MEQVAPAWDESRPDPDIQGRERGSSMMGARPLFTEHSVAVVNRIFHMAKAEGPVDIDPAIRVVQGDITQQNVDVIVNAANKSLLGGGGVDGAIHAAGGPAILEETKLLGGARTGEVKVTTAGDLPASWVAHAVGPIWEGGDQSEHALLALAYRNAVIEAADLGARSIAFPSISTGIYGFPLDVGTRIAAAAVTDTLRTVPNRINSVRFMAFDKPTTAAFEAATGLTSGPSATMTSRGYHRSYQL
jgi:O-acetyl-ADP-ribose deacetylase (regulator of RNase III)